MAIHFHWITLLSFHASGWCFTLFTPRRRMSHCLTGNVPQNPQKVFLSLPLCAARPSALHTQRSSLSPLELCMMVSLWIVLVLTQTWHDDRSLLWWVGTTEVSRGLGNKRLLCGLSPRISSIPFILCKNCQKWRAMQVTGGGLSLQSEKSKGLRVKPY